MCVRQKSRVGNPACPTNQEKRCPAIVRLTGLSVGHTFLTHTPRQLSACQPLDSPASSLDDSSMPPRPLRICLVAFNAYPAVNPQAGGQVGGTETRAWLLARHLAQQPGIEVSIAVRTTESVPESVVANVRIVGLRDRFYRLREAVGGFASRQAGFPWIKVHRWSPALLWQIPLLATARMFEARPGDPRQPMPFFEQIEADLFCCFGNQATAATVIASAHEIGRASCRERV